MIKKLSRQLSEKLQRFLADNSRNKWVYDYLYYNKWITGHLNFFNTAIAPVDDELLALRPNEFESYHAQVYHETIKAYRRIASHTDSLTVLEVACGLGGGIQYISLILPNATVFGIDLSFTSVYRSKKLCGAAHYAVANAHQLPFKSAGFDLIIAVECLNKLDMDLFFAETERLLSPNGVLCVVDFRPRSFLEIHERIKTACSDYNLNLIEISDLTDRVLAASEQDKVRQNRILARIPWGFRQLARELMVMPGSKRHTSYLHKQRCYYLFAAQKSSSL
jgi:ubiquinone/menaquinone biosynthesis C-methylase UbiE